MTATPEQIRLALQNMRQPSRTRCARIREAIQHAKKSRAINPAQDTFAQTNRCTTTEKTQKDEPCQRCKL